MSWSQLILCCVSLPTMYIRSLLLIVAISLVVGSPYYELQQLLNRKRSWSGQIKTCISSCKKLLYKCHKDMNYCIEGCRIRVYKPIYNCVYEQCNNRGMGVNDSFNPSKYHQCVHLCKVRPRQKSGNNSTESFFGDGKNDAFHAQLRLNSSNNDATIH